MQLEKPGNRRIRTKTRRLVLAGLLRNEGFDYVRIGIHDHIPLRQLFDIFIAVRARGFVSDSLDNTLGKFDRQRGFEAH